MTASKKPSIEQNPWSNIHAQNIGYLNNQYERYLENPYPFDESLKELFDRWGAPPLSPFVIEETEQAEVTKSIYAPANTTKIAAVQRLADNIRTYGHLAADINPLKENDEKHVRLLDPATYDLDENELKQLPPDLVWADPPQDIQTAFDAITRLKDVYTQSLAYEFSHVHDPDERNWLQQRVEDEMMNITLSTDHRKALLYRLTEVEGFEQFLQHTFSGQKRFSIEGLDTLVPMIDKIVQTSVYNGGHNVMIGMAHRGRLNVLAHVLGKPYETIFSEFHHAPSKELVPSEGSMGINYGWTGDVKYHLGAERDIKNGDTVQGHVTMAHNPSHLEFVNPVVLGYARAVQETHDHPGFPQQDENKALAILVHGDAAFPGEGVVAETLNLSRLRGYHTGGTIHIIANNQLGFTTESSDARSTAYASDLAKGFEIPIVHVNADDPEACLQATQLAHEYRSRFKKDFLIDLIGYRRYGHNEMDDPSVTQFLLYSKIKGHPTVREQYARHLESRGIVTGENVKKMYAFVQENLKKAYQHLQDNAQPADHLQDNAQPADGSEAQKGGNEEVFLDETMLLTFPEINTKVDRDSLREMNDALLHWPEEFHVYPKLEKILHRRQKAFDGEGKIDWALAETLAFGSILTDGTPIRLTGQDTERGTFAQRHLVLHDHQTGKSFSPLHLLPHARASFSIFNSPLSEASVMGFEYGYSVQSKRVLTLWEAQYGDFANVAQVIIDQFISSGRAKWGQLSSLVLLLPHGYEGQGPEHSNARLERFLQLSAENNWFVTNLTSAAQYFHILRRQAALLGSDQARPLIIMTPKSLLRNKRTISSVSALSDGRFYTVLEHPSLEKNTEQVERLLLCSGKMAIDLQTELEENKHEETQRIHIVRVEQLYPFPQDDIQDIIQRCEKLEEVVWVQEEPENMGAWRYIEPRVHSIVPDHIKVRFIGRPARSSTAEGQPDVHQIEQGRIIRDALNLRAYHPIF